jgi:hypothetical protein
VRFEMGIGETMSNAEIGITLFCYQILSFLLEYSGNLPIFEETSTAHGG